MTLPKEPSVDDTACSSDTPSEAASENPRTIRMFALLLVLAGFLAYENSFSGVFHFDDIPCIVSNDSLKSLKDTWNATANDIPVGLKRRDVGRWTFAINRSLHGLDPWGYHAFNLAIHLAAGLLLFGLARRTMGLPQMSAPIRRHSTLLAFCVSLLWLVHPLQTESVTYIVQRLESLMAMFFLACLYALHRGATGGSKLWYIASVISAGLSIGSKEVGLMVLPVALMYDRIFLASSWSALAKKRVWIYVPILAAVIMFFAIRLGHIPVHIKRPDTAGRRASSWEYLRSQPGVLLHYIQLTFWPKDLCLDYFRQIATDPFEIYGKGSVILGALGTGIALLWRMPAIAFLVLSYFFILAPSSTVVPLHLAFEHRVYLSLGSLFCGVILAIFCGLHRLRGENDQSNSFAASTTLGLTIVAAIALAITTRNRNEVYHSQIAMWSDVVRVSPHNPRGHMNLAIYAAKRGKHDLAEKHFRTGLKLDPTYDELHYNYGCFLMIRRDMPEQAIGFLEKAVRLSPGKSLFRFAFADVLERLKRYEESEKSFRLGLENAPTVPLANLRLGQLLKKQERYEEAEFYLKKSAELEPKLWQPHRELGQIDAERGDVAAAIAHYQFAMDDPRLQPPELFESELAELQERLSSEVISDE